MFNVSVMNLVPLWFFFFYRLMFFYSSTFRHRLHVRLLLLFLTDNLFLVVISRHVSGFCLHGLLSLVHCFNVLLDYFSQRIKALCSSEPHEGKEVSLLITLIIIHSSTFPLEDLIASRLNV